jgi:hypothetical protein
MDKPCGLGFRFSVNEQSYGTGQHWQRLRRLPLRSSPTGDNADQHHLHDGMTDGVCFAVCSRFIAFGAKSEQGMGGRELIVIISNCRHFLDCV